MPSQSGAKEDHGRRHIRPAAISSGCVSWNKRNSRRPINSESRVRNASVLLFCPRDPRHANFQRPVTGAGFGPGTALARSCSWRGWGDSVRKSRSRRPSGPNPKFASSVLQGVANFGIGTLIPVPAIWRQNPSVRHGRACPGHLACEGTAVQRGSGSPGQARR